MVPIFCALWFPISVYYGSRKLCIPICRILCIAISRLHLKSNGEFLHHYGKTLSVLGEFDESIILLHAANRDVFDPILFTTLGYNYHNQFKYEKAENHYITADNIAPNRFYPKYLLTKLYFQTLAAEKCRIMANRVLDMEVKVNSSAIDQIKSEVTLMLRQVDQPPNLLQQARPFGVWEGGL